MASPPYSKTELRETVKRGSGMRSNGFGSFQQTIYFHVSPAWAVNVGELDGMEPVGDFANHSREWFRWKNWSTELHKDDDVVWGLAVQLHGIKGCDWQIDWDRSAY